jgi:anti-sigma factor RsiW
MKEEEIISSGQLELYVTGSLSEDEIREVEEAMAQFPAVRQEVEAIERGLMRLSEVLAHLPPMFGTESLQPHHKRNRLVPDQKVGIGMPLPVGRRPYSFLPDLLI